MLCFRLLAFIVQHMKHSLIGQTFWWSLAPPRIRGGATPIQQSTHNAKCTHFNSTHWRFFFLYSTPLRRRKSAAALAESITAVGDGTGTKLTTAPTITVIVVQKNDHRLFQFVFSQTAANSALVLILRARERESCLWKCLLTWCKKNTFQGRLSLHRTKKHRRVQEKTKILLSTNSDRSKSVSVNTEFRYCSLLLRVETTKRRRRRLRMKGSTARVEQWTGHRGCAIPMSFRTWTTEISLNCAQVTHYEDRLRLECPT